MFRYQTSYRFYTLAKIGFVLAYLWFIADFVRIHIAIGNHLSLLLPDTQSVNLSGNQQLDIVLRKIALFLSRKAMVWVFAFLAPAAAGLFLWGRNKWIQFAVGWWMSFGMISLNCLVGVFSSTVDVWLNLTLIIYGVVALITPADIWETSEAGLNLTRWRGNPSMASAFAWLVVSLQFLVYFFAGVNKLVLGWIPWTRGVALQFLAYDSSFHDFVRGTHVPYWISLILCYVTLFQRLVVPFGFFFRRYRFWSVLILGSMHVGYALLMNVNLFPLIGISSLLMILPPPRTPSAPRIAPKKPRSGQNVISTQVKMATPRYSWVANAVICLLAVTLALESIRLTNFSPMPWENKLMVTPGWRMFADGGLLAGGDWRIIVETPRERIDATDIPRGALPHTWRDRFYINDIFNDLVNKNTGYGSLVDRLARATRIMYRERQLRMNQSPAIRNMGFETYTWKPEGEPTDATGPASHP
jgi:Vitamin K-dependent gamma-carboxylase